MVARDRSLSVTAINDACGCNHERDTIAGVTAAGTATADRSSLHSPTYASAHGYDSGSASSANICRSNSATIPRA